MSGDVTRQWLIDWHAGDPEALARLLERNLAWIRRRVEKRMGPLLEAKGSATDYVQDAMVEILRYGPRFVLSDEAQFRALMAKIIENVLRGRHDWFTAGRRAAAKERPIESESLIELDPASATGTTPSQALDRSDSVEMLRLAIGLLEEDDREVVVLRQWDGLPFEEVGFRLGISADAARMRFQRALVEVAAKVSLLRRGELGALLA